jgi:hypothetical protein
MLTFFPRFFSTRAIICYVVTLALVSVIFMSYALPLQFILFGFVAVLIFFTYVTQLTMKWQFYSEVEFVKKLFVTALLIRVLYVIFIYFYYLAMTGQPNAYHAGDEEFYEYMGSLWRDYGFRETVGLMRFHADLSDRGYAWWLSFECLIFGKHVLPFRLVKCLIDAFSCVLIYRLTKRNFGESTGRMAAVFCLLMPNMWYYCGVTLKETEMAFMVILFVERADYALRSPKITFGNIILPAIVILVMFSFRTAMAAVMMAAFAGAMILSPGKQLQPWKKVVYSSVFVLWMFLTVGTEMIQETQEMWAARTENQAVGYESRATDANGNTFAKYATASIFAPLIFTIPFSSMVATPNQENQMMMNGANFIKNIMSGFTILALFMLLFRGEWRKHVLPIAVMCGYLVVLVFSNFAHSERFHFPALAFELMFAAYGVSQVTNKHKRWYTIWLVGICIANIAWAWIKLAGRGMV